MNSAQRSTVTPKTGLDSLLGDLSTPRRPSTRPSLPQHSSSSPNAGYNATGSGSGSRRAIASMPSRLKSSPVVVKEEEEGRMASPATKSFATRTNRLALQESLNKGLQLPTEEQRLGKKIRISLASASDPREYDYRYMYERMMARSEVLDSTIDEAADILKNYYGIEELGDPSSQSQEDVIAVGRLCPENDTTKLTESSTYLESSRLLGGGSRVLLRFDADMKVRGGPKGSGGLGMFAGCLVGVKGRNGGGRQFSVNEILLMPNIDPTFTKPSTLLDYQWGEKDREARGEPISVMVAAGPYTLDIDLEYSPLAALLEKAAVDRPDVLILLGPFVDAQHPLIKTGDLTVTPNQLFRLQISKKLAALITSSPRTAIILIPNGRDMTSHHVAYPQSPFIRDLELGLPKGVKLLPNPTTFSINEVVFSVTSLDVLFALRSQEMFRKCGEASEGSGMKSETGESSDDAPIDPSAKDIFARACRYLLSQRSFYPIFPVAVGANIDSPNLDITHNKLISMGNTGPDVVIVPSMLKHFAKIVDSTIMINPSYLTRGSSAGTFASLVIHPLSRDELERRVREEEDEEIEHRMWERCRVDIVKI